MAADFDIPREIQMPFFTPSRLPSTQLFSDRSLSELFEELTARINQQIDKIDPEPLLQTPVQDTVEYVIDGTRLQVPTLMYDNRYQLPPLEVKSTVQDYGSSIEVNGFEYRFVVPFDGHLGLFRHSPNTSFGVPPHAGAVDGELRFVFHGYNLSKEELEKALSNQIEGIRVCLAVIEREVDTLSRAFTQCGPKTHRGQTIAHYECSQCRCLGGFPSAPKSRRPTSASDCPTKACDGAAKPSSTRANNLHAGACIVGG